MPNEDVVAPVSSFNARDARLAGQLLLNLVRARRYYLDDFMEGDGPYWIAVGLFVDQELDCETSLERVTEFADESIETSRYLLRQLIERSVVEQYLGAEDQLAYRLTSTFNQRFLTYMDHQVALMRATCQKFAD